MGQKVNPIGFRVGVDHDWRSRWFADKRSFGDFLAEAAFRADFAQPFNLSVVSAIMARHVVALLAAWSKGPICQHFGGKVGFGEVLFRADGDVMPGKVGNPAGGVRGVPDKENGDSVGGED